VLPRNARAEAFFAATGANVRHGGDRAYYAVGSDHIQMPPFEMFHDAESYYVTLAHECTHWTRHENRLYSCRACENVVVQRIGRSRKAARPTQSASVERSTCSAPAKSSAERKPSSNTLWKSTRSSTGARPVSNA
jgi:antirestriction protein ArdC